MVVSLSRVVDESIQNYDVRGTAFDCSIDDEYIVVAGFYNLSIVLPKCLPTSWLHLRSNRQIVKIVRIHNRQNIFSCISGQNVDIYQLGKNFAVQKINSFSAHSQKISDFNWCPNDDNLMVCCAEYDTVSFWDLRETTKPCLELELIFGANQAKFAPYFENLLLSTHGCDMRLWDIRHTIQPINQFTAHEYRIQCLEWHTHEKNTFATSAIDGLLKIWDLADQKSVPNIINVDTISAWKMRYSSDGEELAALSMPSNAESANYVNIFTNSAMENPQSLKNEENDITVDICWQTNVQKSTKYLYALGKKTCLSKHPVSYELINEARDEMATPIVQSAVDEERDRLIVEHTDEVAVSFAGFQVDSLNAEISNSVESEKNKNISDQFSILFNSEKFLSNRQLNKINSNVSSSFSKSSSLDTREIQNLKTSNPIVSNIVGVGTPQSLIVSEWSRWITAPNKTRGDLLTELEALRKPLAEGMYTTEVNFQRAAIGFSYMHCNKSRKINFEMRFHKNFIDNGLVFVEVLQKDSPLTPKKATLFLTLLQQESNEQAKIQSDYTILSRVFLQLPKLVESMKIFTPSIDVPYAQKTPNSSLSESFNDEKVINGTESIMNARGDEFSDVTVSSSLKQTTVVPITYTPSPYDHLVPAPRNCGARFNGAGFLVTFGYINSSSFSNSHASHVNKASINDFATISNNKSGKLVEKQQQNTAEYLPIFSSFQKRNFQNYNSTNLTKKNNDYYLTMASSSASKKEDFLNYTYYNRHHQHYSTSMEIPRIVSNNLSQTFHVIHSPRQPLNNSRLNINCKLVDNLISSNENFRNNKNNFYNSRNSKTFNHRSLADYCISVFVPQQSVIPVTTSSNLITVKKGPNLNLVSGMILNKPVTEVNLMYSGEVLNKALAFVNNDYSNKHSAENSSSTSPTSSNLFSVSTNAMIALALHQPIQTTSDNLSLCATTFTTTTTIAHPIEIASSKAVLQRNNSVTKSVTKMLSSSSNTCSICSPSGTTCGFSLQNVSQSLRHRGNSMSLVNGNNGIGSNPIMVLNTLNSLGTSGKSNASNSFLMIMEEHAVMPELSFNSTVSIYDALGLLPISKELAKKYKLLGGSPEELCRYNLKQVQNSSRPDLIRVWKLLEQCISLSQKKNVLRKNSHNLLTWMPWSLHPFGQEFINCLIDHYYRIFDFQTVAMMVCVLGERKKLNNFYDSNYKSFHNQSENLQRQSFCNTSPNQHINNFSVTEQRCGSTVQSRSLNSSLTPFYQNNQSNSFKTDQKIQLSYRERISDQINDNGFSLFFSKIARSSSFQNENQVITNFVDEKTGNKTYNDFKPKTSLCYGLTSPLQLSLLIQKTDSNIVSAYHSITSLAFSENQNKNTTKTFLNQPENNLIKNDFQKLTVNNFDKNVSVISNLTQNSLHTGDNVNEFLLDPKFSQRFENIRLQYADILYRWGMYIKCAEVIKYCSTPLTNSNFVPITTTNLFTGNSNLINNNQSSNDEVIGLINEISFCGKCDQFLRHTYKCPKCKHPPLFCAVCEKPCYGIIVTCNICSHAGHLNHMAKWFESQTSCPLNCGCDCNIRNF